MKRFFGFFFALMLTMSGCGKPGGDALAYGTTDKSQMNDEQIKLFEQYPKYFGLNASNGLDVIVWQMAEDMYSFGLLEHSDSKRDWISSELLKLKGLDAGEMKLILQTYDIDEKNVFVVPWQNPVSSYMPEYQINLGAEDANEKAEAYIDSVRKMLFGSPNDNHK